MKASEKLKVEDVQKAYAVVCDKLCAYAAVANLDSTDYPQEKLEEYCEACPLFAPMKLIQDKIISNMDDGK